MVPFLLLTTGMTRIVIVPTSLARAAVQSWTPHGPLRRNELEETKRQLDVLPSRDVFCACAVVSDEIRAVSLIERGPSTTVLWTMASKDDVSGTNLLRALRVTLGTSLRIDPCSADRWRVAWGFLAS
jgi:hypothetical protein